MASAVLSLLVVVLVPSFFFLSLLFVSFFLSSFFIRLLCGSVHFHDSQ